MKKFYATFLLGLFTLALHAQTTGYNGPGYYRMHNIHSKNYFNVIGKNCWVASDINVKEGKYNLNNTFLGAVKFLPDENRNGTDYLSNPGTICYVEGENVTTEENADFKSQGASLRDILVSGMSSTDLIRYIGDNWRFQLVKEDDGCYTCYKKVSVKVLFVEKSSPVYLQVLHDTLDLTAQKYNYAHFQMEPLTEENLDYFYFGANPNEKMKRNGKYYTTMYTAFPYKCMDGVKAYYVKEIDESGESNQVICEEITSGEVPENTGVILECPEDPDTKQSKGPKGYRLLPLTTAPAALETNLLKGTCFNLKGVNRMRTLNGEDWLYYYCTPYDESMRVLSYKSGQGVAFYKYDLEKRYANGGDTIYIPANKAYLDCSGVQNNAKPFTMDFSQSTGIRENEIVATKEETDAVYDLQGRKVLYPRRGLYIVNGKKVMIP